MSSKNNKANKPKNILTQPKSTPKTETKESKLQKLVKANPNFQFIENGKVKCIITGHEFAPTLENYEQYLKSKSYKKGVESLFDIIQYEEFLVPFKDNQHFLFCRLTGAKIPKKKTAIEKHVNSRKFKTRMEQILAEDDREQDESLDIVEEDGQEEEVEESEEQSEEREPAKRDKNGKARK